MGGRLTHWRENWSSKSACSVFTTSPPTVPGGGGKDFKGSNDWGRKIKGREVVRREKELKSGNMERESKYYKEKGRKT